MTFALIDATPLPACAFPFGAQGMSRPDGNHSVLACVSHNESERLFTESEYFLMRFWSFPTKRLLHRKASEVQQKRTHV